MFFGLDWLSAFVKISFQIVFSIVTAIPFYFAWNNVAEKYFATYLDEIWLNISYWELVSLLLCVTYIGEIISKIETKADES